MSDTLRINPPPPGAYRPRTAPDAPMKGMCTFAEANKLALRIIDLETGLMKAEARIEALETALAATVRALVYGETTSPYPGPRSHTPYHQHALCGTRTTRQHLFQAAEVLGIDIPCRGTTVKGEHV